MRTATIPVAGEDTLVCGTGYTGEDGVELLMAPAHAPAVWDALLAQGVKPAGLGARDTLRLEACFHLYGNDLSIDRNPIEAGLGWICKLDTGFIGSDALEGVEPEQTLVPFGFTGPGIPRQGNPVSTPAGAGEVTSGTLSPCLDTGAGLAYVPTEAAEPGTEIEVDVRGKPRAAVMSERPLYPPRTRRADRRGRELPRGAEVPPRARLGADRGRRGHVRHHLVRPGRPGRGGVLRPAGGGATVSKDQAYTEVESVKAVSDVFAPLSGEITAVNEKLGESPELINSDPYGDGWLVKVKLSDTASWNPSRRGRV